MSERHSPSVTEAESPKHSAERTLQEALGLLWVVTDRYARTRFLLALILVAGGALLSALTPIALKIIVDALATDDEPSRAPTALSLVAVYVVGQYLFRLFVELRLLTFGQAEQRVRRDVGRRLFEHVVRLPMRFHVERKIGAIGETVEQGLRGYQLLLNHAIYTILPVIIEFLAVAIVLVHFGHHVLLLILGAAAVAYVFAFRRGAVNVQGPAVAGSKAHVEARAVLTDSLLNYETVKYFDAEPVVCNRYGQALGRTESAWRRFLSLRASNGLLVATIFAASLTVSLYYAVDSALRGTMTIGDFVLVNAYVVRVVQPLEMIGFAVRDIAQGVAFLRSLLDLFRERTEGRAPKASEILSVPSRGELVFEQVCFSYLRGRPVLTDVSFWVPAGRTVAIVGASGSGKSSLVRLLFRLYEPDSGGILLDGVPITDMSLSAVRHAIAVVPQDTVLFHDSIAKNIGFGRSGSSRPEIEHAAMVANLHAFILGLPEGYETIVGERGLKLSGGERQRVAIARAVLKRPRMYVFDEATSSLDSKTEREIVRNLQNVSSNSTTLIIAHRLSTVVHADEIIVLEKGVIVEHGAHHSLLERNGVYAALWHVQQGSADLERFETTAA